MRGEIIIEKYGLGNAVVVRDSGKIVDLFLDPPSYSSFYPPNTFVEAKIQRRVSKRGGYFVRLPNGHEGFLKSSIDYSEGEVVVLLSKVFFDEDKPQTFTDKLKIISKYFVLKLGKSGVSFSRRTISSFDKDKLISFLREKIKGREDIFIICRSRVAHISRKQIVEELEKILQHHQTIMREIFFKKNYCDGEAKKIAFDKYDFEEYAVIEEQGVFERLGLWDKIDELCQKKFFINKDSYLVFEQTKAFYAIDVNSGKNFKVGAKELNLLACSEICRLIKILGIGGKIIIDFLPCSQGEKRIIFDFIVQSFLNDIPKNKVWGWTDGGLFELEREREKSPLKILLKHN